LRSALMTVKHDSVKERCFGEDILRCDNIGRHIHNQRHNNTNQAQEYLQPMVIRSLRDETKIFYPIHTRKHLHTHARTHPRTHAHIHAHTRACTHKGTHVHPHARRHTHARTHARTDTRTHAHTDARAYFPFCFFPCEYGY